MISAWVGAPQNWSGNKFSKEIFEVLRTSQ